LRKSIRSLNKENVVIKTLINNDNMVSLQYWTFKSQNLTTIIFAKIGSSKHLEILKYNVSFVYENLPLKFEKDISGNNNLRVLGSILIKICPDEIDYITNWC